MADSTDLRSKPFPRTAAKDSSSDLAPDQQGIDLEPLPSKGGFSRRSFLSGLSGFGAAGILAGAAPSAVASADALMDPGALDAFSALAAQRREHEAGR